MPNRIQIIEVSDNEYLFEGRSYNNRTKKKIAIE